MNKHTYKADKITCNISSQSSLPTKIISRGSLWRVPPLLTKNQDVKLIFCLASKSLAKLHHPARDIMIILVLVTIYQNVQIDSGKEVV